MWKRRHHKQNPDKIGGTIYKNRGTIYENEGTINKIGGTIYKNRGTIYENEDTINKIGGTIYESNDNWILAVMAPHTFATADVSSSFAKTVNNLYNVCLVGNRSIDINVMLATGFG